MKQIILIIISIIISIPISGRAEDELILIVRPGDTARSVTERYLVRPTAWERVVQYNYILKPGNLIRVPAELVKRDGKAFLSSVFGDVTVKSSEGNEWLKATDGLILRAGDTVRSGMRSGAVLRMGRDDEAVLRSSTEVVFEPYKRLLTGKANRITINTGTIRSEERRVGKECRSRLSPSH